VVASRQANRVNTVLFDLDDTLLDSYRARIGALQDVFTQAKITSVTAESFLSNLQGAVFNEEIGRLAEKNSIKDSLFISYRHAYWIKKSGRIRLYPGISEMLRTLKARGFKLGIVTNKGRDFEFEGKRVGCRYELKEVGIADLFSAVIGFDDVREQKPHPEGINLALNQLGSEPDITLFVGDSAVDIQAAQNAGCWSCLATWGITDATGLPEKTLRAHFTVKSPRALLALDCL
jgi:pyrophosphatase PpaX